MRSTGPGRRCWRCRSSAGCAGIIPTTRSSWSRFRGGDLLATALERAPSVVALDPLEPWNHDDPDPPRVRAIRDRLASSGPVDITLLVSVAAGQLLPYLPTPGRVVTWVVERGDGPPLVVEPGRPGRSTDRWLAGSRGSATELLRCSDRPGGGRARVRRRCHRARPGPRRTLPGPARPIGRRLVVVGAGIATHRKAPDLFLEVALCRRRRCGSDEPFVWLGGEHDPLFHVVRSESRRLGVRRTAASRFRGRRRSLARCGRHRPAPGSPRLVPPRLPPRGAGRNTRGDVRRSQRCDGDVR